MAGHDMDINYANEIPASLLVDVCHLSFDLASTKSGYNVQNKYRHFQLPKYKYIHYDV